jgi:hypothetical protein
MTGRPVDEVEQDLDRLDNAQLVRGTATGRYAFQDLIRLYAAETTHGEDCAAARRAAARSLLTHYLYTSTAAGEALYPHRIQVPLPPPPPTLPIIRFADAAAALCCLETEVPNLIAAIHHAAHAGENRAARSIRETYRSGRILHTVATVCGDEGATGDTVLRHLHDTVESGTRHPIALVAALENGTGYRAALRNGAGKCIRTVREAGHNDLADSLDLDVRNAVAHRSYRVTSGGIDVLNDSGNLTKHLTAAELVDLLAGGSVLSSDRVHYLSDDLVRQPDFNRRDHLRYRKSLQRAMRSYGYTGPVDGVPGANT